MNSTKRKFAKIKTPEKNAIAIATEHANEFQEFGIAGRVEGAGVGRGSARGGAGVAPASTPNMFGKVSVHFPFSGGGSRPHRPGCDWPIRHG